MVSAVPTPPSLPKVRTPTRNRRSRKLIDEKTMKAKMSTLEFTLTPSTSDVVIKSYSKDKLVATLLEWYKRNPDSANPKASDITGRKKAELISEVIRTRELMVFHQSMEVTNPNPATSDDIDDPPLVTQTQSQPTSPLIHEDIMRLLNEKYHSLHQMDIPEKLINHKDDTQQLQLLNDLGPDYEPEVLSPIEDDDMSVQSNSYEEDDRDEADDSGSDGSDDASVGDDDTTFSDTDEPGIDVGSLSESIVNLMDLSASDNDSDDESASGSDDDDEDATKNHAEKQVAPVHTQPADDNPNNVSIPECPHTPDIDDESIEGEDMEVDEPQETPPETETSTTPTNTTVSSKPTQTLNVSSHQQTSHQPLPPSSTKNSTKVKKTSSTKSKKSLLPSRVFTGLGYGAERLNGCDLTNLAPDDEDMGRNSKSGSAVVKELHRTTFYVRPQLHIHDSRHAPTLIKDFMRVFRQVDPTLILLPFDADNTSLNGIIHNDSLLPEDKDKMDKWVKQIEYDKHQKLCFSVRMSCTMDMYDFKEHMFGWCKRFQHWTTFDDMPATKTFSAGWLCCLHHKHVDIDQLKAWMDSFDESGKLSPLYKIYPRKIYQTVPGTLEKRVTDVLACVCKGG